MDSTLQKTELRRWARGRRPPTPDETGAVIDGLVRWLRDQSPSSVLVYLSMPGELPAEAVVEGLGDRHRFLVTRTPPTGSLTIHDFGAPRERHRFGYDQPTAGAERVAPSEVGIVLVPGLCFDRWGGRVGWGKGYYDRLLAEVPPIARAIGLTLDRLLVPRVPVESHDRAMTHLATERGVHPVENR